MIADSLHKVVDVGSNEDEDEHLDDLTLYILRPLERREPFRLAS